MFVFLMPSLDINVKNLALCGAGVCVRGGGGGKTSLPFKYLPRSRYWLQYLVCRLVLAVAAVVTNASVLVNACA